MTIGDILSSTRRKAHYQRFPPSQASTGLTTKLGAQNYNIVAVQSLRAAGGTHLHDCLAGVYGHEHNPEGCSCRGGSKGFDAHVQVSSCFVAVEKGQGSCVCCGVTEAGQGSLKQGRSKASVEPWNAAIPAGSNSQSSS